MTEGQPVARDMLMHEVCADVATVDDDRDILTILRRHSTARRCASPTATS